MWTWCASSHKWNVFGGINASEASPTLCCISTKKANGIRLRNSNNKHEVVCEFPVVIANLEKLTCRLKSPPSPEMWIRLQQCNGIRIAPIGRSTCWTRKRGELSGVRHWILAARHTYYLQVSWIKLPQQLCDWCYDFKYNFCQKKKLWNNLAKNLVSPLDALLVQLCPGLLMHESVEGILDPIEY